MKKTNLYVAHGGIGKCVLFSSLIDAFSERDNDKISIACGFPEVLKFHPKINSAPQWTGGDLRHDIAEYFDDIIFLDTIAPPIVINKSGWKFSNSSSNPKI